MKTLNPIVYNKLLIQAQEAKTQGLNKLSSGILNAVGPFAENIETPYSHKQLEDEVYNEMWRLATHVMKYHDVEKVDAAQVHQKLEALASQFIEDLEQSLKVEDVVAGPHEPKLPGEQE